MQNCPRSCPSRQLSKDEVGRMDTEDDCLPMEIVKNIAIWNASISKPLKMREYDVATFDSESGCFQEYQKSANEMRYQLQNGQKYIRQECPEESEKSSDPISSSVN